jgi:hypothetical protein
MKRAWIGILVWGLGLSCLGAAEAPYRVLKGPGEFYYGHISLTDVRNDGADPLVFRDGSDKGEPAALNMPIGPGDLIRTTGERRIEIQFDNATIVRLDADSELKIETLLAQSLSSRSQVSNLVLRRGRCYIMYKEYSSKELFQVLLPRAAVKLRHNSVALVGLSAAGDAEIQVLAGKASLLFGADQKAPLDRNIYAKERVTIDRSGHTAAAEYRPDGDFESWNKSINDDFLELHKGLTPLPKPVQRMSPGIFRFAQQFGNRYGEWLYDDYFGYVWRPYYNDHYPWGTWSPYYAGRWTSYNNQMFWVPTEPWGWIPYHLGVWQWDKKKGWYWIPGSAFAPAWVDWAFYGGGFWAWRPWSMWDWGFTDYPYLFGNWFMGSMYWYGDWRWGWSYGGYNPWMGQGYPSGPGADMPGSAGGGDNTLRQIRKDQLRPPGRSPFEMPREFQAGLKALMKGLERRDPDAVGSLLALGDQVRTIDQRSLTAPDVGEKSVPLAGLLAAARELPLPDALKALLTAPPLDSARSGDLAARRFAANQRQTGRAERLAGLRDGERPLAPGRGFPARLLQALNPPAPVRHLDWNPDVRLATRLGVEVRYASAANEIYSPQLNISSHTVQDRGLVAGGMAGYTRGGDGGGSSGGGGGYAGGSGGAVSGGSTTAVSTATTTQTSGGGGGGHIK